MARVTVEDCLEHVDNRFQLVVLAAKRARQLMRGKSAKVSWDNDKATVVALREIAAGYTGANLLEDAHDEDDVSSIFSIENETKTTTLISSNEQIDTHDK